MPLWAALLLSNACYSGSQHRSGSQQCVAVAVLGLQCSRAYMAVLIVARALLNAALGTNAVQTAADGIMMASVLQPLAVQTQKARQTRAPAVSLFSRISTNTHRSLVADPRLAAN